MVMRRGMVRWSGLRGLMLFGVRAFFAAPRGSGLMFASGSAPGLVRGCGLWGRQGVFMVFVERRRHTIGRNTGRRRDARKSHHAARHAGKQAKPEKGASAHHGCIPAKRVTRGQEAAHTSHVTLRFTAGQTCVTTLFKPAFACTFIR
jgi:hypothetical protein